MPPPLNAEININIKVIPMLRFNVFVISHHLLPYWWILSASPRIWEQLLFNIRWLIYYMWWSIANRNSHFSFLHHMSEANASYLEWNGKCFITKLLHLKMLHFYEARLSAYEAFCGIAAKYEAPQMRYEAKPFQASCFFALKSRQKNGGSVFAHPSYAGTRREGFDTSEAKWARASQIAGREAQGNP